MYSNKLDIYIGDTINSIYNALIESKKILKLLTNKDFGKDKELVDIIQKIVTIIDVDFIRTIVIKEDNVKVIVNIVTKYIIYFFILLFGFYYTDTDDVFIENIINLSKNDITRKEFYTPETINNLSEYKKIIDIIKFLLKITKEKVNFNETSKLYIIAKTFVDQYEDYLKTINKKDQSRIIISYILLGIIYVEKDKKYIFDLLENIETKDAEYMYIDIIVPTEKYIDYNNVENIMTERDKKYISVDQLWNYITESNQIKKDIKTSEEKIIKLIEIGILCPIVEDLLLYHRDSERYEKTTDITEKKKEDTKIKYITNKIDLATDLYSKDKLKDTKLQEEIKKTFYNPMSNRKVVLTNTLEDVKIITKFINQGAKIMESNEYFNDFVNYTKYPYVNFKEFNKSGFTLNVNKHINVIRSIGLESSNKNELIQIRSANETNINVIGFAIPNKEIELGCMQVKDFIEMQKKENMSMYEIIQDNLDNYIATMQKEGKSLYLFFDNTLKNIELKDYEENTTLIQENIKKILEKLYDDLIKLMLTKIQNTLNNLEEIEIHKAYSMLNNLNTKYEEVKELEEYHDLEELIYYDKAIKIEDKYDDLEDIVRGVTGEYEELVNINKTKQEKFSSIVIDTEKLLSGIEEEKEVVNAICQHNITWDYITSLKNIDVNKHLQILFEFLQKYLIESSLGDYICRSCGASLNIKKYVPDGGFNDEGSFVPFASQIDVELTDIPEYEKYKRLIRNLDKVIDKIATISNIPYYSGSAYSIRSHRKQVIKDTIDLFNIHSKNIKKNFKERKNILGKKYNINNELSDMWMFDLDDNIFEFTAKDKDYYKPIKRNNIIVYLVIMMILEINESNLSYMSGDKKGLCSYAIYEKNGHVLFDHFKIIKNKANDLDNIKNYPVLCYVLYILSCMITKYNLWNFEHKKSRQKEFKEPSKKSKEATKKILAVLVQKSILNTMIDILNSILEEINNKNYEYEIFSTKFFTKLKTFFNNQEILNRFSDYNISSTLGEGKKYILSKIEQFNLTGIFTRTFFEPSFYNKCRLGKYYPPKRIDNRKINNRINNLTNCENGPFHNWSGKNKNATCTLCNKTIEELKNNNKTSKSIEENLHYYQLQNLAHKLCLVDGEPHLYLFNTEKQISICQKCNKDENYNYSKQDLDKLDNIIKSKKQQKIKKEMNIIKEEKEEIMQEYNENIIEKFIDKIKEIIGNEKSLLFDTYIIDHDYQGMTLSNPIYIINYDNKVLLKKNHNIFNTDVLYYQDSKNTEIYYNATNLLLIGYKEKNKEIKKLRSNKQLKISYSLINKLNILGYENRFTNIENNIDKNDPVDIEFKIRNLIKNIIRIRIDNLKKAIYKFQGIINRIINGYKIEKEENKDEVINKYTELLIEHSPKLYNINTANRFNKEKVFKDWNKYINNIYTTDIEDININKTDKFIDNNFINKIDKNGNKILYYIVNELIKLLDYNENKLIKNNIVKFYIDFIDWIYTEFNKDLLLSDIKNKTFNYLIKSIRYVDVGIETSGIYEEQKIDLEQTEEDINNRDDDIEEQEALDIDMEEFDYQSEFESSYEPENRE